ncbi:hypothetical protein GCM10007063_00350 [Lentibacillus kapialis]|uniref:Uncharacterized protein n=1 Tax=Lentibacillus kapialis TaxID=340214 RepID=A0A917PJH7_9BACI|nr:hypothetical protein [Lentibacillus kapialis]GGJ81867.1 hypothetical protein GCM10007063_00350 [Lentibacillus kapialis]
MTLEGSIPAIIMFILVIIIALVISYLYGWKMIEITGLFGSQTFIASVINLFLWTLSIFGWFLYTAEIGKELFFGGLVLGTVLLMIGEAALIITLFLRRHKFMDTYHEQTNRNVRERNNEEKDNAGNDE